METVEVEPVGLDEEVNIYGDICDFDLGEEIEKLRAENKKLEEHIVALNGNIDKLNDTIGELKDTQNNLSRNISSLFLTAKSEVERKNRMIEELREQVDSKRINRFNPDMNKRKDRENSPSEANNPKKFKFDDNTTRNTMLDSDNQETKSEDKQEPRPKRSDNYRYPEDNNRYRHRSDHSNDRYDDQYGRNRYDSRAKRSNERYNENDRFESRNKYYNDRYSNYEDDGYCSRSKYSCDRTDRYKNENEDRYDSRSQYFGDRYNSRANSYVNSERAEGYDDRDYQNSCWNSKNNVEDRRSRDRDDYKYESERHNRYSNRRSVDQCDSRYLRSERNRSLERETRFEASHPRLGTPPFEQDQETRRSITPMPLPEDIEVPKPKPPKKRLKMLEEMEKKVKQSRLSQAGSGLSNESDRTVEKNKQNNIRNRSNSAASQSTGCDNNRNSGASSRSTKSDKGDVGSHGNMHQKEEAKRNRERTPNKTGMTNEKFKSRNSDVSKKVVEQTQEIESKLIKMKNVNATPRDTKQNVSERKSVNDSRRKSGEKKNCAIAESVSTIADKVVLNISKGTTNVTEQNTDVQKTSVKNVRNEIVRTTVKNASETLIKADPHKQTQQKECTEASKRSTEETAKEVLTKGGKEKDKKNEKITSSGKQSNRSTESQPGKVARRDDIKNDVLEDTNKGLTTKEENLAEQHARRSEQDVKHVEKEAKKARRKSMSVEQVVVNIKNKIAELKGDTTEKSEDKRCKFSTETSGKRSQDNKEQTEQVIESEMKRSSENISNAPQQDTDKDIKTDIKTIKKEMKTNSEGAIQKQPKKETESSKKVSRNKTIDTEKKDSADLKNIESQQSRNTKKPEANVTVDKDKTTINANQNKQRDRVNEVEVGVSKEEKEKKGLKEDLKNDAMENVHPKVQAKDKNFDEQQFEPAEKDTKKKRRKSTSAESGVDNCKNKMRKSEDSTKQDKSIESKKVSTESRGKQSQISKEEKSEQKQSSENVSNVPKQGIDTVVDIKTNKTAKKIMEINSERTVHKHPENEAVKNKIFDDATAGTEEQVIVKRKSIEDEQSSDVTKSEGIVAPDKGKTKTNINQNEQKIRVNEVKRRIKFSKEGTVAGMDHKVESKLDSQNVPSEALTKENSKHDTISEDKQMALENSEDCKIIVNEPINDDLNGKNSVQESVHPNNKQGNSTSTNNTSIAEDGNKNDTKSKEAHISKTQETSKESPHTSSEDEPLKRITKNKDLTNILSTSSSMDSESASEELSDDILNKTIPKLIEIKDVQQKCARTIERFSSLSDSSTSDDTIATSKPDSMKLVEEKFDNLLKNYIENFKSDSPENKTKAAEPKIKILEVINIVNTQGKVEIHTMRNVENPVAGSSIDSSSTEKSSAITSSPATQINTPNSVRPTRRRITPTPVKDDKPLCTFENILTKTCQSEAFPTTKQTMESPLHLTHEGEIPVLHLEENHINDLPTEMNINDKNIITLLDTMNISNIDCDIPKFKSVSGEGTGNSEVSGGGGDNNGLTFENIMEKVTSTPVRTQDTEGSVGETPIPTVNSCVSIRETPNSNVTSASTSALSSDKMVNSNVQSGTKSTPFRRRRRCWMVIRDK